MVQWGNAGREAKHYFLIIFPSMCTVLLSFHDTTFYEKKLSSVLGVQF